MQIYMYHSLSTKCINAVDLILIIEINIEIL